MFMSGSNIKEAADLKDVIATDKRWQDTRLVCGPLQLFMFKWLTNELSFSEMTTLPGK